MHRGLPFVYRLLNTGLFGLQCAPPGALALSFNVVPDNGYRLQVRLKREGVRRPSVPPMRLLLLADETVWDRVVLEAGQFP